LKNYEVGVKSQWLDKKLTVNGAVFTGSVTGYQYSYIDFATASPVTGTLDKVRINGGELEARFVAMPGLNLFANVGVAVPKIKESLRFPQYVGNETPRASNYSLQGALTTLGRCRSACLSLSPRMSSTRVSVTGTSTISISRIQDLSQRKPGLTNWRPDGHPLGQEPPGY